VQRIQDQRSFVSPGHIGIKSKDLYTTCPELLKCCVHLLHFHSWITMYDAKIHAMCSQFAGGRKAKTRAATQDDGPILMIAEFICHDTE
jgi:hypothetical protein